MELEDIRRIEQSLQRFEAGHAVLESDFDEIRDISSELMQQAEDNENLSEAWTAVFETARDRLSDIAELIRIADQLAEDTEHHSENVSELVEQLSSKIEGTEDIVRQLISAATEINSTADRDPIFAREADRFHRQVVSVSEQIRDFHGHRRIARRIPDVEREIEEENEQIESFDDTSQQIRDRTESVREMIDDLI